ncbi:MAG TPA: FAD-dependent oxidoreductase [Candidatus Anammoximicrobium sp.]|nr:FAD-dependent oxidoreductase [Candidatus Anammoximicrobium sp.]
MVNESARKIPVAYEADVVVVGGGTGAVSAAIAAAKDGGKVFLAAPHPYLGDEMTATLRLWLEEGETPASPLAQRVFGDRSQPLVDPNRIPYQYEADLPSAGVHRDTAPPSRLTDGRWDSASSESVQYDGDVQITADLAQAQEIRTVRVMFYRRAPGSAGGSPFDVKRITVSLSDDKEQWKPAAVMENDLPDSDSATLQAAINVRARYVRFHVQKPEGIERILLGEIEIIGPEKTPVQEAGRETPLPPRPMHVKNTLDDELLAAGVRYLYSCYATDVLRDADGQVAGIVIANRAGRQAVIAKVVIDATDRAAVARIAGAKFSPYPAGHLTFRQVVIGGQPKSGPDMTARVIGDGYPIVGVSRGGQLQRVLDDRRRVARGLAELAPA